MKGICAWFKCAKEFEAENPRQLYCCDRCKEAAGSYRQNEKRRGRTLENTVWHTKVCKWDPCGKTFKTQSKGQDYCCDACRAAAVSDRGKKKREAAAEKRAAEKAKAPKKESAIMRVTSPEKKPEAHAWAKEDEDMRDPLRERARETMPSIVPKPRCKLERDVLEARKAGAKSYGYYKAFQIIE